MSRGVPEGEQYLCCLSVPRARPPRIVRARMAASASMSATATKAAAAITHHTVPRAKFWPEIAIGWRVLADGRTQLLRDVPCHRSRSAHTGGRGQWRNRERARH